MKFRPFPFPTIRYLIFFSAAVIMSRLMEMYPSGWRVRIRNPLGAERRAGVQIPPSPPIRKPPHRGGFLIGEQEDGGFEQIGSNSPGDCWSPGRAPAIHWLNQIPPSSPKTNRHSDTTEWRLFYTQNHYLGNFLGKKSPPIDCLSLFQIVKRHVIVKMRA